jgi:hypothetical protein
MAKAKNESRAKQWPYLSAGLICEKVLIEADKVPSFMRIVDQLTLPRPVEAFPSNMTVGMNLSLVVSFRPGGFKGTLPLKIEQVGPSRKRSMFIEHQMTFPAIPVEAGSTVGIQMNIKWDGEGIYWFEVFLGGKWRTRIPLRLSFVKEPPSVDSSPKKVGKTV